MTASAKRPGLARAKLLLKNLDGNHSEAGLRLVGTPQPPGVLSSGVPSIDVATGIGGYPSGRIVLLHSGEGLGKTTLALLAIAECQRLGGVAIFLDYECKLDERWAQLNGVDTEALFVCHPKHIEEGMVIIDRAVTALREAEDADYPVLIVWDSLQAAGAKRSIDKDYDEGNFNPEPLAYSGGLKKLVPKIFVTRTVLMAISQVRTDISGYGSKQKVGVGKAWLHHATQILILRGSRIKGRTDLQGNKVEVFVQKNQVAIPNLTAQFEFHDGVGVFQPSALLEAALALGLAERKGNYYTMDVAGENIKFQGTSGIAKMTPLQLAALKDAIYSKIGTGTPHLGPEIEA